MTKPKAGDAFENKIYPTTAVFRQRVDSRRGNDVHIYLVYARGIGGSVAGYFLLAR